MVWACALDRMKLLVAIFCLAILAAGCGGDSDSSDDSGSGADADATTTIVNESPETTESTETTETTEASEDEESGSDEGSSTPGAQGTATVSLDNGETFEFSVLCTLEPQEAAGSTILFTATSYDQPYHFDITQFGEDSFGGSATISIYDAETFDIIWEADSFMTGDEVDLALDGSTISGSGMFVAGGELGAESVPGTVEVNC